MRHGLVFRLVLILGSIAILVTGCSRDPNVRKQKYFESGQRYFEQGKYREAAIQFQNAIQVDDRYAEAHYQLYQTYVKLQDRQAFKELSRTLEVQPDNYPARLDMANGLIAAYSLRRTDMSLLDQAEEQIDKFRTDQSVRSPGYNPADPLVCETNIAAAICVQAHEAHANLLAAQGNVSAAIREIRTAISLAPDRWENYLNLAILQMKAQPEAAEANFKKAVELNPHAMSAQLALGKYYVQRNRLPEAEQQFRHAIEVDPQDTEARSSLAHLYLLEGKKAEAEQFLQQVKRDLPDNPSAYPMLGDFYFATGDLDKATQEYASLRESHPKDLQVKKNYIQLLILKNRLDEATKLDDEILKTAPNDNEALVYRGQIEIRSGHAEEATRTLETAVKNYPENAVAHYHLGLALDQLGNLARAESEWRQAVQINSDLTEAHRALAAVALRKQDMGALQQSAEQVIRLQPASPDGYVLRAISFINRKQFPRAEEDVKKAIDLAPQNAAGYIQMGNLRSAEKQFNDAEKSYQQALEHDPKSAEALSGLMNTYLVQKQTDKAVAAANTQIAKVPDSSAFYDLLGTVLLDGKKDLNGAEAALKKAAELDKNNGDALAKLGTVQVEKGSVDEAIATYQKSVQDNPNASIFYILMGELYESKQDWEKAKQSYQKALDLKPDDPTASNNLAYVMLETGGNVDVALSLAQTARRGLPDSPNAADTLGWVFYQKGAYQSARDLFEEALRLAEKSKMPEDPTLHYHMGLAYDKTNEPLKAREHLERVLKLSPNYSSAADVKRVLSQLHS